MAAETPATRGAYSWYALSVLVAAYVLAFVDRQVLNLLVAPIKRDLHLSDVEISLLQGLSFALFLSIGGLPIGRLIDSRPRPRLLAACIALWSAMTAGCGMAASFLQFLLCRIGVGVGEAAMTPSAYSLIGDYFDDRRQGAAMALYSVGAYVGSGLALIIGAAVAAQVPAGRIAVGPLGAIAGWQLVFLIIAVPGIALALWVATLREPRRGSGHSAPALNDVLRFFRGRARALIAVNLAVAFAALAVQALLAWLPSFFLRHFGIPTNASGPIIGIIIIIAGSAGTLSAGLVGDRLAMRWADARLRVLIGGVVLAAPCAVAALNAATADAALAMLVPAIYGLTLAIGSGPATLQQVTPPAMRGVQHAVAVLAVNLIGLGLGPTVVALFSDRIFHDEARVGEALAITVASTLALSVVAALMARAPYRRARAIAVA